MVLEKNVLLAPLTTFKIGGRARFFSRAQTIGDIYEALLSAREQNYPVFILGGGSNVLVSDGGFSGVVIKNELLGISFEKKGRHTLLVAGAGENWDDLVALAVSKELSGLENLSGIPGTVGASPVQNIGAYSSEVGDVIEWVEALDGETGKVKRFSKERCNFSYRDSFFKSRAGRRYVVVRVAYRLTLGRVANVSYADLRNYFAGKKTKPDSAEVRAAVLEIRMKKFPDWSLKGTAGSYFKNPVVSSAILKSLLSKIPELPHYSAGGGKHKISLAFIIDRVCGLKGARIGGAAISEHQALSIVNVGRASAEDVRSLAREVSSAVRKETGILIEPEVEFIEG